MKYKQIFTYLGLLLVQMPYKVVLMSDPHPQPPLGLAYLAGVLERFDDVHVLDIIDGNFSENYVYDVKWL